jgi:hypothetical protein
MIAYARKEIAFAKWKASGYRDLEARREFEYWHDICQQILAERKTR